MDLTLKIWRQAGPEAKGEMKTYPISGVEEDMSFLEMLDFLNEQLIDQGIEPVVFDHDCREGICGMCSLFINGEAHGPGRKITTCQLHMREFKSGDTIYIEPFRAKAFPIIKDLMVVLTVQKSKKKSLAVFGRWILQNYNTARLKTYYRVKNSRDK